MQSISLKQGRPHSLAALLQPKGSSVDETAIGILYRAETEQCRPDERCRECEYSSKISAQ
jgi:hypothetical protein